MDDNIIICRCEDISWGEIRKKLDRGYATPDEIKRITRAGMGPCQGKTCQMIMINAIASYLKKEVNSIPLPTFRPPVKPIPLGIIANGGDD